MADVTEVIHKISYEVNDEALINATKAIQAQIVELDKLQKTLRSYTQQLSTQSAKESKQIDILLLKINNANNKITELASKAQGAIVEVLKGISKGVGVEPDVQKNIAEYVNNVKSSYQSLVKDVDAYKKSTIGFAKDSGKALSEGTKSTDFSFKKLAKSLTSTTGLLDVGISLLISFGLELIKESGILDQFATKQGKVVTETDKIITKFSALTNKVAESAAKELTSSKLLYQTATDVNQSYQLRLQAVSELQKKYPAYFGNLSKEAILAGKAADKYKQLSSAIIAKATVQVYEEELLELIKQQQIIDKNIKSSQNLQKYQQQNATIKYKNGRTEVVSGIVNNNQKIAKSYQDIINKYEAERTANLQEQDRLTTKILDTQNKYKDLFMSNSSSTATDAGVSSSQQHSQQQPRVLSSIDKIEPRRLTQLTSNIDQPEITPYEIDVDAILAEHKKLSKELRGLDEEQIKKIKTALSAYQELASAAVDAYKLISKAQQEALDKEIEIREKRVADAKKLAERGNADVLRIEEQRLEEAQKKKEQIAQREQQVNSALALSNSLVAVTSAIATATKSGDPYTVALRVAAAVAAVIAALGAGQNFVRSFDTSTDSFADGVVGYKGKGGPRDDSNWVRISNGESVITAAGTSKHRSLLEAINNGQAFTMAGNGLPYIMPTFQSPEGVVSRGSISNSNMRSVERKLDNVVAAIEDNRLRQNIFFNEQGVGLMTERAIKKNNRRFK